MAIASAIAAIAMLAGCRSSPPLATHIQPSLDSAVLMPVDVTDTLKPAATHGTIDLAAARNEWISFAIEIRNPHGTGWLRLNIFQSETHQTIGISSLSAYQVLPMPVDANTAGYVRYTGFPASNQPLPRALLPVASSGGVVDLSGLRDPSRPFDPAGRAGAQPVLIWIDVRVPTNAAAGDYRATCDLLSRRHAAPTARLNISLHVHDFTIPDERHLQMVSRVGWDSLERLYPDRFEAITPRLLNRTDDTYAGAIRTLDQLVQLAQTNRAEVVFARLQPTVKWPPGEPPQADWSDFDSVISPWMSGAVFPDKIPLGYWPLPAIDHLENFDAPSRRDYWSNAARHFNEQDWLGRCPVYIEKSTPGRAGALESVQISMLAEQILRAHPRLRVMAPLEDEQLQFASADDPDLLDPRAVDRIVSASTGLVFASPTQSWPVELKRPAHWLRTDLPGLMSFVGAGGNERDVRVWAWLAFIKRADLILWGNALPEQDVPTEPADPSNLVWFYPGSWFGVDAPVPSVQLKWLRRAQQDYEYLLLAAQRGMSSDALMLARLMTKQVEIAPAQSPDAEYGLLSGTIEQQTWDQAQSLLARTILLHPPGPARQTSQTASRETALNLDMIRWQQPKERPFILSRVARWLWDNPQNSNGDHWVAVRLGVDIYNAGDSRPDQNLLQWTSAGNGWEFSPRPVVLDALRTYGVQRFWLQAGVDLDRVGSNRAGPASRQPLEISFMDGFTRNEYHSQTMLPVAASDRREGHLTIDGKLDEWYPSDLINDGPLTRMLDRPSVQRWRMEPASAPSQVYTTWADENFYLAFRVGGVTAMQPRRNFVDFQLRRAWGEDLCEALIQPINDDNTMGPITYLACKPGGVCVVKRRAASPTTLEPWQEIAGSEVRYAANAAQGVWTGEVAIPWKLILAGDSPRPRLLRFNFIQHVAANGESASWAGPIDYDMDDSYMGLIFMRDSGASGMDATH